MESRQLSFHGNIESSLLKFFFLFFLFHQTMQRQPRIQTQSIPAATNQSESRQCTRPLAESKLRQYDNHYLGRQYVVNNTPSSVSLNNLAILLLLFGVGVS